MSYYLQTIKRNINVSNYIDLKNTGLNLLSHDINKIKSDIESLSHNRDTKIVRFTTPSQDIDNIKIDIEQAVEYFTQRELDHYWCMIIRPGPITKSISLLVYKTEHYIDLNTLHHTEVRKMVSHIVDDPYTVPPPGPVTLFVVTINHCTNVSTNRSWYYIANYTTNQYSSAIVDEIFEYSSAIIPSLVSEIVSQEF